MRILTWNINSVRLRIDQLARLVREAEPDVVCLQETKVPDDKFPLLECRSMGFEHIETHGMKGYNGVAVLSRRPIAASRTPSWCGREDCRHLIAVIDGIEVHCLYVPSGGDVPDPAVNDKFAHKLDFLDELTGWYAAEYRREQPVVLCGDFNVAPLETDVWSHRQMLKVISHTPVEVERLNRLAASLDWVDAARAFIPPEQHLYTWWSYRARDWRKSNRGRRLDHVWVTPALKPRLRAARVIDATRDWNPPSDHVPVVVDLAED